MIPEFCISELPLQKLQWISPKVSWSIPVAAPRELPPASLLKSPKRQCPSMGGSAKGINWSITQAKTRGMMKFRTNMMKHELISTFKKIHLLSSLYFTKLTAHMVFLKTLTWPKGAYKKHLGVATYNRSFRKIVCCFFLSLSLFVVVIVILTKSLSHTSTSIFHRLPIQNSKAPFVVGTPQCTSQQLRSGPDLDHALQRLQCRYPQLPPFFSALKGDDENPHQNGHAVNPVAFHDVPSTNRYAATKRQRVCFLENPLGHACIMYQSIEYVCDILCITFYAWVANGTWLTIPTHPTKHPGESKWFQTYRYSPTYLWLSCNCALHRSLKPETLCLQKRLCPSPKLTWGKHGIYL